MSTKNATYANSGAMDDYLKFLLGNAETNNEVYSKYRCYCKVLHEYHDFLWYDEYQKPHIIENCDAFLEYEENDDSQKNDKDSHKINNSESLNNETKKSVLNLLNDK